MRKKERINQYTTHQGSKLQFSRIITSFLLYFVSTRTLHTYINVTGLPKYDFNSNTMQCFTLQNVFHMTWALLENFTFLKKTLISAALKCSYTGDLFPFFFWQILITKYRLKKAIKSSLRSLRSCWCFPSASLVMQLSGIHGRIYSILIAHYIDGCILYPTLRIC